MSCLIVGTFFLDRGEKHNHISESLATHWESSDHRYGE